MLAGRLHELPHPDRLGAAGRGVGEPALDEREIDQVARQSFALQPIPDHRLVSRHAVEPDVQSLASPALEELEVPLHPRVIVEGLDVDVPGDRVRQLGRVGIRCIAVDPVGRMPIRRVPRAPLRRRRSRRRVEARRPARRWESECREMERAGGTSVSSSASASSGRASVSTSPGSGSGAGFGCLDPPQATRSSRVRRRNRDMNSTPYGGEPNRVRPLFGGTSLQSAGRDAI